MDEIARAQIDALERRVEDLERNLRLVFEHAGLETSTLDRDQLAVDPQIEELLREGRVVQAIKRYADRHGTDLMTAKLAIERIHAGGDH